MKNIFLFFTCIIFVNLSFGQRPTAYGKLVQKADSLYKAKEYIASANTYSEAFKANGWKGTQLDRYNAGCSWALAGNADSAFFQLNRIATKMNYANYDHILKDTDLNALHNDKRWQSFVELVKQNKEKMEANLNRPLMAELDSILIYDQKYRKQIKEIDAKYGKESAEMKAHWKLINYTDSLNLIKVTAILDKYGWVGEEIVGSEGNKAIFLVIQHANIAVQQKYLPMMREAVKNKKAKGSDLALLEDRVALREGKKQLYGSQIGVNPATNEHYVLPLEDPDNVDKRREEVGLPPLSTYLEYWNTKWDVEQYKKDLPAIEALQKK
jgi:hypothetical protein